MRQIKTAVQKELGGLLIQRARALRIAARLPANLWPEVFKTAGYLNNRKPKKILGWTTLIEAITKERLQLAVFFV